MPYGIPAILYHIITRKLNIYLPVFFLKFFYTLFKVLFDFLICAPALRLCNISEFLK